MRREPAGNGGRLFRCAQLMQPRPDVSCDSARLLQERKEEIERDYAARQDRLFDRAVRQVESCDKDKNRALLNSSYTLSTQ